MSPLKLVVLCAALVTSTCSCTALKQSAISGEAESWLTKSFREGADITQVAEGVYSYRWGGYRTAFVTTSEGVVLFDPLNEEAAADLSQRIKAVAPNPDIKYVIYSHAHRDHVAGGRKLPGTPRIVAHANADRDIRAHANADVVPPTEVFAEDRRDLAIGGVTLQLIHLPASHTDGMLAILIPDRHVLYSADLVLPKGITPFAVSGASFSGVKRALTELASLPYSVFVPGHGPIGTKTDVIEFGRFIGDLEGAVRTGLKQHDVEDPNRQRSFLRSRKELAHVFFDAEDALRRRYEKLQGFDEVIFPMAQWCFYAILMGDV